MRIKRLIASIFYLNIVIASGNAFEVNFADLRNISTDEAVARLKEYRNISSKINIGDQYSYVGNGISITYNDTPENGKECSYVDKNTFTVVDITAEEYYVLIDSETNYSNGNCPNMEKAAYKKVIISNLQKDRDDFRIDRLPETEVIFQEGQLGANKYMMMFYTMEKHSVEVRIRLGRAFWAESNFVKIKDAAGIITFQRVYSKVTNIPIENISWKDIDQVRM